MSLSSGSDQGSRPAGKQRAVVDLESSSASSLESVGAAPRPADGGAILTADKLGRRRSRVRSGALHCLTAVEVLVAIATLAGTVAVWPQLAHCGPLLILIVAALILHVVLVSRRCFVSYAAVRGRRSRGYAQLGEFGLDGSGDDEIDEFFGGVGTSSAPAKASGKQGQRAKRRSRPPRAQPIAPFCRCALCDCSPVGVAINCGLCLVVGLVVAGLVVAVGLAWFAGSTLPSDSGELRLPGLTETVTVVRDGNGVIHIEAANEADLFFAQGAVAFQERGFQMDFFRRVAAGNLSAILGDATLATDKYLRTLGLRRSANEAWNELGDAYEESFVLTSFAAGVNAYLATRPPLQPEFYLLGVGHADIKPFDEVDVLSMAKIMDLDLCMQADLEARRFGMLHDLGMSLDRLAQVNPPIHGPTIIQTEDLGGFSSAPTTGADTPPSGPLFSALEQAIYDLGSGVFSETGREKWLRRSAAHAFGETVAELLPATWWRGPVETGATMRASNNWVVGGSRTASGKPLLCNDPHLAISLPPLWMLVELKAPTVHVTGAAIALLPMVMIGRNDYIAWGQTNVGTDVQDLYIMQEDPSGTRYFHNGTYHDYEVVNEVILLKNGSSLEFPVRRSLYGPVISEVMDDVPDAYALSLKWVSLEGGDTTAVAYYRLNKATTWTEFREAQRLIHTPAQNCIFASAGDDGIGYQTQGLIPIRRPGHTGSVPVPGDGSYDWLGFVPFEENPFVHNPVSDYVATANSRVAPYAYEHPILNNADWEVPWRTTRIRTVIEEAGLGAHTVATMRALQTDTTSDFVKEWQQRVIPVLQAIPGRSPEVAAALTEIAAWDANAAVESVTASTFYLWWAQITVWFGDALGGRPRWNNPTFIMAAIVGGDPLCGSDSDCAGVVIGILENVLGDPRSGEEWGKVHAFQMDNPVLSQSPLACMADRTVHRGGGPATVNVASFDPATMRSAHGPSYRQVIDLSDMDGKSVFMSTGGQSGNLFSSAYANMAPLWAEGSYYPMTTTDYDADRTQTLVP